MTGEKSNTIFLPRRLSTRGLTELDISELERMEIC